MTVAVVGANGFVGGRIFEIWQRRGPHRPRAVVRSPSSLARIARFDADWQLADARDVAALTRAFAGCDAIVHCVAGDERMIAATIEPVYRSAVAAGAKKLVYLSSAAVHGQNPAPGTTDNSVLRTDHPIGYNNAKVRAERLLQRLGGDRKIETVILRPGIVFGPRSRWVVEVADALTNGDAYWVNGGRGICNSIYVDNLVHGIEQAIAAPGVHGQAFLLGDVETVTWRDFYLGLAASLGWGEDAFQDVSPAPAPVRTWRDQLGELKATPAVQRMLPWFSPRLKDSVKAVLARWQAPPADDLWALPGGRLPPTATFEMSELFACRTKLPHAKAEQMLNYAPSVSFAEGLVRSGAWLKEAGYRTHGAAAKTE